MGKTPVGKTPVGKTPVGKTPPLHRTLMSCSWLSAGCKEKEKGMLHRLPRVLVALIELGEDAEPSVVVITGCE